MSKLTAYRVTYSNGQVIPTSMAAGVTPEMARDYFLGKQFELTEGVTATATKVEKYLPCEKCGKPSAVALDVVVLDCCTASFF